MSVSKNIYLGPYIVCTVKVKEVKIDKCGHPNTGEFCSTCGIKQKDRYKTAEIEEPNLHKELEYEDSLSFTNNYGTYDEKQGEEILRDYVLVPNGTKGLNRTCRFDKVEVYQDLINFDMNSEIEWFQNKFKKELDRLKEICKIKICWGIRIYYS